MSSLRSTLKVLAALLPLEAGGISSALAAAPGKPADPETTIDNVRPDVATRLAAIRSAVSQMTVEQSRLQPGDPNIQKAWWSNWAPRFWGNWHPGWGNGGWHNGWGNGGWGNGGWHNGGWGNGGWHNWHNW
ncbi:MAG: GrrA/OscA1 family cyclophane-containing rSAM-modified RiPP [Acetobacteraceae bacterium]